jgi:hypothetical protein
MTDAQEYTPGLCSRRCSPNGGSTGVVLEVVMRAVSLRRAEVVAGAGA